MDRHLDIDNFEGLLKDRSEEFKMYPTKRVWHSIYNNIHPGKKWPSIATCIVLISILLLIGFLNTNDTPGNASIIKNKNPNNISTALFPSAESKFFTPFLEINIAGIHKEPIYFGVTNNLPAKLSIQNATPSGFSNKDINANGLVALLGENSGITVQSTNLPSPKNTNNKINLSSNAIIINKSDATIQNNALTNNLSEPNNNVDNINIIAKQLIYSNNIGGKDNLFSDDPLNKFSTDNKAAINLNTDNTNSEEKVTIENNNFINLTESVAKTQNLDNNKKVTKKEAKVFNKIFNKETTYKPLVLSETDKAWIENFALYNRPIPKKWAGKLGWQLYLTPSVVYRTLKNNFPNDGDINKAVTQHPSMGLEIGAGIIYPIFKGVKIKTGLQLNSTRYNTEAFENSHPVSTSITLHDASGQYYENSRTTPFSNNGGITPTNLHNDTYQISIPIGMEIKIAGNDNLQWNIAATIQPSYVFGGRSYLISADKRNFIKETTFINRWNLNAGFETFISYKLDGITFQIGPQYRKQIFTTNSKVYTVQEKLTNYGLRFGITKLIK